VSVTAIVTNLLLNLWLNSLLGFKGLALGTAISANINAGLLVYLLSRRIGGIDGARLASSLAKILVASLVMGVATFFAEGQLHAMFPAERFAMHLIRVTGGIAAGLGTLAVAAWVLRIQEFHAAVDKVMGRLRA
jgi:putative peptidoglycan lipid II flippase